MNNTANTYIGPYRLSKLVNNGQTCQLWQAVNDRTNDFVALKTLVPRHLNNKAELAFLNWEYTVGSQLKSPYCIKTVDYGMDGEKPYLVIEWFAAPNMKSFVREGVDKCGYRLPVILPKVIQALAHLHSKGFIHRDVKPENFLVNDKNEVKLIDFAIAQKKKTFLSSILGGKPKVQGTRSYMSPEQIRAQWVDERADIYSLGCMFFELVVGKAPFSGQTEKELFQKHLNAPAPLASNLNPNVTKEFGDMIRQMLAKNPAERYQSMNDLFNAFHAIKIFSRTPIPPKE